MVAIILIPFTFTLSQIVSAQIPTARTVVLTIALWLEFSHLPFFYA